MLVGIPGRRYADNPGTGCSVLFSNCISKIANNGTRTRKPSALEIELNSSKAIAGKELSLSSWCIASLYFYHAFLNCG